MYLDSHMTSAPVSASWEILVKAARNCLDLCSRNHLTHCPLLHLFINVHKLLLQKKVENS